MLSAAREKKIPPNNSRVYISSPSITRKYHFEFFITSFINQQYLNMWGNPFGGGMNSEMRSDMWIQQNVPGGLNSK